MKLVVHIGCEKTGSTAIQSQLLHDEALLAEHGIFFCRSAGEGNNRALASACMDNARSDDFFAAQGLVDDAARVAWREQLLQEFFAEVDQARAIAETFLISSEHLHSRLWHDSEVMALGDLLRPLFSEIQVLCYLRRQDELALSLYSQKLRAGRVPPTVLPLETISDSQSLPRYFNYEDLLRRWSRAFGSENLRPRLFSPASLVGGDVVEDFYAQLQLPAPQGRNAAASNRALSATAQAALLLYNEHSLQRPGHQDTRRPVRMALARYLEASSQGPTLLPGLDEARAFYRAFADANARVARTWFQREQLFPEDFNRYPEAQQEPDWAAAAALLADFLASCAAVTVDQP